MDVKLFRSMTLGLLFRCESNCLPDSKNCGSGPMSVLFTSTSTHSTDQQRNCLQLQKKGYHFILRACCLGRQSITLIKQGWKTHDHINSLSFMFDFKVFTSKLKPQFSILSN